MKKRVLSFIAAIMLLFSCGLNAYAATTYTTGKKYFNDLKVDDAINVADVLSLGIMKGDDLGYFNPNSYLTKAEATTIILRMVGKQSSLTYSVSSFKDVTAADWFAQPVNQATALGLVAGEGNGYFNPRKNVTALELITMCLRVCGIGEQLDATGYWPYAHMQFVNDYGIITNYTNSVYDPITRLDAAGIVSDFLSANVWEKNVRTGVYEIQDDTVASKYLNVSTYKDCIITAVHKNDATLDLLYKDSEGEYTLDLEDVKLNNDVSIEDFAVGMVVSLSLNGSYAMKINIQDEASSRIVLFDTIVDYDADGDFIKIKVNGKTSKYYFNEYQLTVEANGITKTGYENKMSTVKRLIENTISETAEDDAEETIYSQVSGRLVLDENSKIVSMNIYKYDNIIFISKIASSKITGYRCSYFNTLSSTTLQTLNLKNTEYTIVDVDGTELEFSDLSKGDVILTSSSEPYYILKLDQTVYGKVTECYDDSDTDLENRYITISNEDYYLNTKFCTELPSESNTKRTIYLDQNGKIVGWK